MAALGHSRPIRDTVVRSVQEEMAFSTIKPTKMAVRDRPKSPVVARSLIYNPLRL
jgi:hypothetical protein